MGLGITVLVSESLASGGEIVASIANIDKYSHEISIDGGFRSADIEFQTTVNDSEEWFVNGVGRDIIIKTETGQTIFRGFVNSVAIDTGKSLETVGPLTDIANRIIVNYKMIPSDLSSSSPSSPISMFTPAIDDEKSQSKYGIIEKIFNCGDATMEEAQNMASLLLKELAWPQSSNNINYGSAHTPGRVTLNVKGYCFYYEAYIYENFDVGVTEISSKIGNIIYENPNEFIGKGVMYLTIDENMFLVNTEETGNQSAWSIIQRLINLGDSNDNRAVFMLDENNEPHYKIITGEEVDYYYKAFGDDLIQDKYGNSVDYRLVRPGKFIEAVDFANEYILNNDVYGNPRIKFIESVSFSSPYSLNIVGSKIRRSGMILAKYGLGGI